MRLTLFGEGPERGRLERFVAAARHGATGSPCPGRVGRDQLRERYWDSDIYLTPARLEAFGIAALEARTAGLPVVARRDTGVGDFVVDGVNGLLGADDEALAQGLAQAAHATPELRAAHRRHQPHRRARAGLAVGRRAGRGRVPAGRCVVTESAAPVATPGHGDPIVVRAHAADGRLVAEFVLGHGADPVRELARLGWSRPRLRDADRDADGVAASSPTR